MGKHLDEYIEMMTKAIESENNGLGKVIHKELRALAEAIQKDLGEE